jgi:hypothetical protein
MMDDRHDRRTTDRWHVMELAIPMGALFLLLIGSVFAWTLGSTVNEQHRLRDEHGHLLEQITHSCRKRK